MRNTNICQPVSIRPLSVTSLKYLLAALQGVMILTVFFFIRHKIFQRHLGTNDVANKTQTATSANPVPVLSSSVLRLNDTIIAIGGGLTLKFHRNSPEKLFTRGSHITHKLLPSFCKTINLRDYSYRFYFTYDYDDPILSKAYLRCRFEQTFLETLTKHCPANISITLTLKSCPYSGKPAWAQNDAMMLAYFEGADYFFRINDDTEFITTGWTEAFVQCLSENVPQNLGIVGPSYKQGNVAILTYEFVHRTHIEMFGFYYPRIFRDWYGDAWITNVYKPKWKTKLSKVQVSHMMNVGTRYHIQKYYNVSDLRKQHKFGKYWLSMYLQFLEKFKDDPKRFLSPAVDNKEKVILLFVHDNRNAVITGAIRNTQLAKVLLPAWIVQIFIKKTLLQVKSFAKYLATLKMLGADIKVSDNLENQYNFSDSTGVLLPLLGILTIPASHILVRNPEYRLSRRESIAVSEWIESSYAFHCIRDHPSYKNYSMVAGLWGIKRKAKYNADQVITDILQKFQTSPRNTSNSKLPDPNAVLSNVFSPYLGGEVLYHDSVPDPELPNSLPLPPPYLYEQEHIGQRFDEHMLPVL